MMNDHHDFQRVDPVLGINFASTSEWKYFECIIVDETISHSNALLSTWILYSLSWTWSEGVQFACHGYLTIILCLSSSIIFRIELVCLLQWEHFHFSIFPMESEFFSSIAVLWCASNWPWYDLKHGDNVS
jgi:hypothetical protein